MPDAPKTLDQIKRGGRKQRDERPSSHARGYDRHWSRERKAFLAAHPFCHDCYSIGVIGNGLADEVHHVDKVATHPHLRLDWSNLIALCKSHHSKRTARGE